MAKFVKGQSGNPNGRPRGSQNRYAAFKEAVDASLEDLVSVLIGQALAGDMAAMRLLLERSIPKVQSERGADSSDLPPLIIQLASGNSNEEPND